MCPGELDRINNRRGFICLFRFASCRLLGLYTGDFLKCITEVTAGAKTQIQSNLRNRTLGCYKQKLGPFYAGIPMSGEMGPPLGEGETQESFVFAFAVGPFLCHFINAHT